MPVVTVQHRTSYYYRLPVVLGDHELMVRPLAGEDLRVLDARLFISSSAKLRRSRDEFGNAVEKISFADNHVSELTVVSKFTVNHRPRSLDDIERAMRTHFWKAPASSDLSMLEAGRTPHRKDLDGKVLAWATDALGGRASCNPLDVIAALTDRIYESFRYVYRPEKGTQDAETTLSLGTGACRDFACLLIEAARSLGYSARFVSGYLYDDLLVEAEESADPLVGGASSHGWAQVYIARAGWVDFDPTNALVGGRNLLPSAVALDPSQVVPIGGKFHGPKDAFDHMEVDVAIQCSSTHRSTAFGSSATGLDGLS
jgi:transglutaminase-like putative cysteine protease